MSCGGKIHLEGNGILRANVISRPGQSQGLLYKHFFDSLINSFIHPLVKISLQRRHAQTVKNGASSHKTNYIDILTEILNLEAHLNRWIGSKVMAILLNGWILPTCGVASGRVGPAACTAGVFLFHLWLYILYEGTADGNWFFYGGLLLCITRAYMISLPLPFPSMWTQLMGLSLHTSHYYI